MSEMQDTLDTLNMLVALAAVMLLLSFAVTLQTQLFVALFNLRGWALRIKVQNLLVLIDNGIHPQEAGQIAGLVLRNALIGQSGLPWWRQHPTCRDRRKKKRRRFPFEMGFRTAAVVQREELARLLLAFGKHPREYPARWYWFAFRVLDTKSLQNLMRASLKGNGIDKPEDLLNALRLRTLELERSHPELSNSQRQTLAMLQVDRSNFLGKLNGWFDQTVDRAGDLFTGWAHLVAFLMAALVALVLQIDSIGLIDDLSRHGGARLITPPTSFGEWRDNWCLTAPCAHLHHATIAGVVLSAFLLSLGGPFWYATLSGLVKLRSTLADKDDSQRKDRQTNTVASQPAPQSTPRAARPTGRVGAR